MPVPPSSHAALAGAEVLVNLSASNITIGKAEARRLLCGSQSARGIAAYAYSASGPGESTTDLAWDGHAAIYECGDQLVEFGALREGLDHRARRRRSRPHPPGAAAQQRLRRLRAAGGASKVARFRKIDFALDAPRDSVALDRAVERFPYVPSDPAKLRDNCYEAYNIQIQGLAQRLQSSRTERAIIGVSGGLDSTQALIVTCRAMDQLGLPRKNVLAYTLPGFGTSDKTHKNAWRLMTALGVTAAEIDIKPAARQMLADIGHPFAKGEKVYDVTFENVQAGLRTDYLFRLANQHRGMVVGTGDLSELGLGWCTYGVGDHMSHYNPNGSVSKTLIQHLIRFVAASGDVDKETAAILHDILDTEISPELIPAGAGGAIQSTEQSVGPYALQDFNLYYLTRLGYRPSKIAFLAWNAWHDVEEGAWPANLPAGRGAPYAGRDPALAGTVPAALLHQPVQALGAAQRPKISSAARCRRAATGVRRRTAARRLAGRAGLERTVGAPIPTVQEAVMPTCPSRRERLLLIVKAREFDVQDVGPTRRFEPADDRRSRARGASDNPVPELRSSSRLGRGRADRPVALLWLGRGDGTAGDWIDLRDEASAAPAGRAYLLGEPLLATISRKACRSSDFRVRNSKSIVSERLPLVQ